MIKQYKNCYILTGKEFKLLRHWRHKWRTFAFDTTDIQHMENALDEINLIERDITTNSHLSLEIL